jgi:DNA-directed RNA polymerase subunit H (RpoH/RPB5)
MSTNSSNNRILDIYNSRLNLLKILETAGFEQGEYSGFSINEIDAMASKNQLDMLLSNPKFGTKAFVKYYLTERISSRQIRPNMLKDVVDELYNIESVLTKPDTLIIIIDVEPNDSIQATVRHLYDHDGIYVVIHNIKRLQYNILEHKLVPPMSVLTPEEKEAFMKKFNIQNVLQLPEIGRFDPLALALCVRPGQVCKIKRVSQTAMMNDYYRVCV